MAMDNQRPLIACNATSENKILKNLKLPKRTLNFTCISCTVEPNIHLSCLNFPLLMIINNPCICTAAKNVCSENGIKCFCSTENSDEVECKRHNVKIYICFKTKRR